MVQVHFARFYKPKSRGINCMTLHNSKLALARSDNSIEIWNILNTPYIERTIPYTLEQDIQGLIWCKSRLFSCDLQGFLNEYDLTSLCVKSKLSVTGEAAYCVDVNKTNDRIAVGTDQGYVNIFLITDDNEVLFEKFLDKQEGKVLCLKYDPTGQFIVTGSIDVIRIFDVNRGHALHKMSTGRSEKNKPTITWCLTVLNDFVIVTGDSRGKLTFWDGKIGAQIESYQSHKADILSICVDEDTIYSAGVDPVISSYTKVNLKDQNKNKWVKNIQRKIHDHDVKCLISYKNMLFSGGIDGYLSLSYHPPKTLVKYPPFINNCVSLSKNKLLLLQYSNYLEIWRLGDSEDDPDCNQMYKIKNVPKKLASVERQIKDSRGIKEREFILCSCISKNGKYIAYSTSTFVNLLELKDLNEKLNLSQIKLDLFESCTKISFTNDSKELILATIKRQLIIYNLESNCRKVLETEPHLNDAITLLTISNDFLAISDTNGNIVVYKKDKTWTFYCKLPKHISPPISIAISLQNNLVVAYSDNKISEFEINNQKFSTFFKFFDTSALNHCRNKHLPIKNITYDEFNQHVVMLHDDERIIVVNKNKIPIDEPERKIAKLDKVLLGKKTGITTFSNHQHLLHLEQFSEKEYVAVEVNPMSLISELPPCLKQTTFGNK